MIFALLSLMFFSQAVPLETVVASMNNRAITYSEVLQEGELLNIENNFPPETPLSAEMKQTILELIFFRIIAFEEAREHEVTVDEKLVRQKVDTYKKNVNMKAFIEKYELTDFEFKTIIKMRLITDKMTNRFLEQKFPKGKRISEEEKRKAVDDWKKNLLKRQKLMIFSMP
ncbi:hypothetical protein IKO70_04020 [bacterium]|jgi:hypothetical protein|nr:hypothetical protein [bacterium]